MKTYGWGFTTIPFSTQAPVAHLLKGGGTPACGTAYVVAVGRHTGDIANDKKCRHCKRIKVRGS